MSFFAVKKPLLGTSILSPWLSHLLIIAFVIFQLLPLYLAMVAASHEGAELMQGPLPFLPGTALLSNLKQVLSQGLAATGGIPLYKMLLNSLLMASLIAAGKVLLALFSAYALVYFELPGKKLFFALIFLTMMLPVEVRIVPTFQVLAQLHCLNTYTGLTLPLMASATATFLFQQFFRTLPHSLLDAAKLDGAGPLRFFWDILLPLSRTQMIALFITMFVYAWNQYLWPLIVTTDSSRATIVMGIRYVADVADQVPQWQLVMSMAIIALIPPCLVVLFLQRWFEKGLSET